jgi:hypothetical protein
MKWSDEHLDTFVLLTLATNTFEVWPRTKLGQASFQRLELRGLVAFDGFSDEGWREWRITLTGEALAEAIRAEAFAFLSAQGLAPPPPVPS